MKVMAAPGLKCPMERKPRQYITDDMPVDVPDTPYYRRLAADGSLVEIKGRAGRRGKKPASERTKS